MGDTGRRTRTVNDQAIYAYAFVNAGQIDRWRRRADAASGVLVHRVGDIAALYREVPVATFCGTEGERNLADLSWIMPQFRREAVVESAMACSPVFPLRFATLYGTLESLSDHMMRNAPVIGGFLRRMEDRREWALKIIGDIDDAAELDALATEIWPEWSEFAPGKRYLRMRRERPFLLSTPHASASPASRQKSSRRSVPSQPIPND